MPPPFDPHKAKRAAKVQPFSELLASAAAGKPPRSWNGMQAYVVEPKTGKVLVNVGGDELHDPASLTKLALFYVAQEAIKEKKLSLSKEITITPEMAKVTFTKLKVGEKMTIGLLLDAVMIESDNGAAKIIADQVRIARGGRDPVDLMNAAMKRLGLPNTHFINAGGLPAKDDDSSKPGERKTTTAKEMALLIGFIHRDFKDAMQQHMTAQTVRYGRNPKEKSDGPDHNLHQANHFLLKPGSPVRVPEGYQVAAKTGRTNDAGNVIAALITAPDGRQLISVVFAPKDMDAAVARGIGVPEKMIGQKSVINGNRARDTLEHQLVEHFIGAPSREVAKAVPVAPAARSEPKPEPQKAEQEPKPDILRGLPSAAQEAVAECRKTIEIRTRPGPENSAKAELAKVPKELADDLAELNQARKNLAAEEARFANLQKKHPKTKPSKELLRLRGAAEKKATAVAADEEFLAQLNAIERQSDPTIFTQDHYDKELASAKRYIDAFVDKWDKALPDGGKTVLRKKLKGVIEGAAGIETGWNPETVKGTANRGQFTGVFQTSWAYIADAKRAFDNSESVKALLDQNPRDAAVLNLLFPPPKGVVLSAAEKKANLEKQLEKVRGLPTTSFAGQGAIMGAMVVASYKNYVSEAKGDPNKFSGQGVYQDHMLGAGNAGNLRAQLKDEADKPGASHIGASVYNQNFLITKAPYANLNDLNPARLTYREATPNDVVKMVRDKAVHAYVKGKNKGISPEKLEAFELAYFPEWTDGSPKAQDIKAQDIARVVAQKATGLQLRVDTQAKIETLAQSGQGLSPAIRDQILCDILKPMPGKAPQTSAIARR